MKAKQEIRVGLDALRTRVAAHRQRRVAAALAQRRHPTNRAEKLTPNRCAAARQLMPSSRTAETTRLRKSTDKGPIPRRLRFGAPQESHFQRVGNTAQFNPAGNRSSHMGRSCFRRGERQVWRRPQS